MSPLQNGDLILLVPGKDESAALDAMLARPKALGIRTVDYRVERHERRDAGCRLEAPAYLKSATSQYAHAIVIFDREGCGSTESRESLEADLERRLAESGWGDRAAVIVIDPELENWMWSDSPRVDEALGWHGKSPTLRQWLQSDGKLGEGESKPVRPKEAAEAAMRKVTKRRTSQVYTDIASRVSLNRCIDPAYMKLLTVLRGWFATGNK
ncbi:MAG: hypothetical protein ABSH22_06955 [Tepidisphaeraceae bacterium]|jgi:hypothetical protein